MAETAIRVENLGKRYHIGRTQQRHDTPSATLRTGLRDALTGIMPRITRTSQVVFWFSRNSRNSRPKLLGNSPEFLRRIKARRGGEHTSGRAATWLAPCCSRYVVTIGRYLVTKGSGPTRQWRTNKMKRFHLMLTIWLAVFLGCLMTEPAYAQGRVVWSAPQLLSNPDRRSGTPAVAADAAGNVHIMWSKR